MSRFAVRQGISGQRKLGNSQSAAVVAARKKQRHEMDFLSEMRQVMARETQGPSAADCVLVSEARKKRDDDRFERDDKDVGYRVPGKSRDYQASLDEVMGGLAARMQTTQEARKKAFLRRPKGPEPGSADYAASEATRNNIYAQLLASPARRAILSDAVLPRAMLDAFVSAKSESEHSADGPLFAYVLPVIDGKPVLHKGLVDVPNLAISAKWYQKTGLLRFQAGFGTDERRMNSVPVRVTRQQGSGRNRMFGMDELLEVGLVERDKVIEGVRALEGGYSGSDAVTLDFETPSLTPFEHQDGQLTRIFFSACGIEAQDVGLDGNTVVERSEKLSPLLVDVFRHHLRIKGIHELNPEAYKMEDLRKRENNDEEEPVEVKGGEKDKRQDVGENTRSRRDQRQDEGRRDQRQGQKQGQRQGQRQDQRKNQKQDQRQSQKQDQKQDQRRNGRKDQGKQKSKKSKSDNEINTSKSQSDDSGDSFLSGEF
ncbi:hypothetical protein CJU89_3771 [Yarrowia sp. B02]|nr:hypothetical protein CJU89_3771 [Yarrowia sp. B02]